MHYPATVTTRRHLAEVSVSLTGSAGPCLMYSRADGRQFIAGLPGAPYTISVRNLSVGRIEIIGSVDGRHVLKDEPAHPHNSRGIVIPGCTAYTFPGWRFNDEETGDFVFGRPEASVAAQAGTPSNIGVIGIAVWPERSAPSYHSRAKSIPVAAATGGATADCSYEGAAAAAASIGTGIGERRHNPVGRTDFTRSGGGPDVVEIGYDTEDELRRRGIILGVAADPQAFPASPTGYERYTPLSQS
jgi:hypothetical protein